MIKSNKDIIKEKFLKFYDNDTYYVIKVFSRKKYAIVDNTEDVFKNIFGSHNERLISNFTITNEEDFEKYCKVAEYLVDSIPYTRAYFNVNPKSKKKTLIQLNDRANRLTESFINGDNIDLAKQVQALSFSILSGADSDKHRDLNWIILDVDVYEDKHKDSVSNNCTKIVNFITMLKACNINYVEYRTVNGHHFVINHKDYGKHFINPNSQLCGDYKEFISNDFVDEKKNSAALLFWKRR